MITKYQLLFEIYNKNEILKENLINIEFYALYLHNLTMVTSY